MVNNIITNNTIEQYNKKYRHHKNLLKFTKKEVEEFDKQANTKGENYLLRNNKWWLIGDTYYQVPKALHHYWFRNLNGAIQVGCCLLGAGAIASAITVPIVLLNKQAGPDVSIGDVDKIEWSNKHYDKDGNAVITIKGKGSNVITGFEISIENYQLSENDFTYNKSTGELLIKKACLDAHKGKIEIKPLFKSEVTISLNKTSLVLGKGDTYQLKATVNPSETPVLWTSSDENVLAVEATTGKLTASKTNTGDNIVITAKAGDATATCKVKVQMASSEYLVFEDGESADECTVSANKSVTLPEHIIIPEIAPNTNVIKYVTKLDNFHGIDNIKSISLPNRLKDIGSNGFCGCTSLKEFSLDNNDNFCTDKNNSMLFNKNKTTLYAYPSAIGECDLSEYNELNSIKCGALCYTLITSLKFPESLTTFDDLLYSCKQLEKIYIHKDLNIDDYCFYDCPKLVEYNVDDENPYFSTSEDKTILFNKDKTKLISYLGATGEVDLNVVAPNAISTGVNALNGSKITKFIFNDKMIVPGVYIFHNCEYLEEITFPSSVVYLPGLSFAPSVNKVYIEDTSNWLATDRSELSDPETAATKLKEEYELSKDYFNKANFALNEETFEYKLESVTTSFGLTHNNDLYVPSAFYSEDYEEFYIVSSIKKNAFSVFATSGTGNINRLVLPYTIRSIEEQAFTKNNPSVFGDGLTCEIVLNEGLKEIGSKALAYNSSNEKIVIPSTVETIGEDAFYGTCNQYNNLIFIKSPNVYGKGHFEMLKNSRLLEAGAPSPGTPEVNKPFYVPEDAEIADEFANLGYNKVTDPGSIVEGWDLYSLIV